MCISDGVLLDGELNELDASELAAHLDRCQQCRDRAALIAARAGRVAQLFSELGPNPADMRTDPRAAYLRLDRAGAAIREPLHRRVFARRFTPAWGAAAAVLVALGLSASGAGRAFAQKILGMLRVNAVVAVPIERNFMAEARSDVLQQVLAESVVKTKEGRTVLAVNREEAGRLAGYDIHLPELRQDQPILKVHTARAFQFTASQQRLATLLSAVGRTDLAPPPNLDGAKVYVDAPASVEATYGDCLTDNAPRPAGPLRFDTCLTVGQAPSPTVVTIPELNLQSIAEFGLQLAGMSPQQARTFSQAIDWTSTLAIPIPRDAATYELVNVNGAKGILMNGLRPRRSDLPPSYTLLWAKNGMIYSVRGYGSSSLAVPLAESLR